MAKIGQGVIKDFKDGEYVHEVDLDQAFETVRVALNDADTKADRVVTFENRVTGLEFVGNQRDVRVRESFVATEGQTLFTLTKGTYKVGFQLLDVTVSNSASYTATALDQATIWNSLLYAGSGLTETSTSSFTLDTGAPAGSIVTATYYLANAPLGLPHGATHKAGGLDPLNVSDLVGYSTITTNIATAKSEAISAAATDAQTKATTAETNAKTASIPLTQKGAVNGVATLDTNGRLVQFDAITYGTTTLTASFPVFLSPNYTVVTLTIPINSTCREVEVSVGGSGAFVVYRNFNYVKSYDWGNINYSMINDIGIYPSNKSIGSTTTNNSQVAYINGLFYGGNNDSDIGLLDAYISGSSLILKVTNKTTTVHDVQSETFNYLIRG